MLHFIEAWTLAMICDEDDGDVNQMHPPDVAYRAPRLIIT